MPREPSLERMVTASCRTDASPSSSAATTYAEAVGWAIRPSASSIARRTAASRDESASPRRGIAAIGSRASAAMAVGAARWIAGNGGNRGHRRFRVRRCPHGHLAQTVDRRPHDLRIVVGCRFPPQQFDGLRAAAVSDRLRGCGPSIRLRRGQRAAQRIKGRRRIDRPERACGGNGELIVRPPR